MMTACIHGGQTYRDSRGIDYCGYCNQRLEDVLAERLTPRDLEWLFKLHIDPALKPVRR
jgi:hypothetical protein